MAKSKQQNSSQKTLYMSTMLRDIDSNQNQHTFKTSSMKLLRAKYDRKSSNDPTYLAGASKVLRFMNEAWTNTNFCDLYFHVGDEYIQAHKIAVASYSPTLADQFCQHQKGENVVLDVRDFSRETILTILNFVYTTDIEFTDDNVGPVLRCSVELDLDLLVQLGRNYLETFNLSNALDFYSIAEDTNSTEQQLNIQNFICEHFIDLVNSSNFVLMSFEKLFRIMNFDVCIKSELDVFLAIVRWIDSSRATRLPMAPKLLHCVKFRTMTPEVLATEVEIHSHIFDDKACYDMLYDAMKFHALRLSGSKLMASYDQSQLRPRAPGSMRKIPEKRTPRPQDPNKSVYNINQNFYSAPRTSLKKQDKNLLSSPPRNITPRATATPTYNPLTPTYNPSTPTYNRSTPTYNHSTPTYNRSTPTYHQPSPALSLMHSFDPLCTSSAESIYSNHLMGAGSTLVAIGGINLNSDDLNQPGKCIYQFHPEQNCWHLLTTMKTSTHHHAAVVIGGKIFVLGGCTGENIDSREQLGTATNRLAIYDPALTTWFPSTTMNHCRAYTNAAVHQNSIYVVGGEDENKKKTDTIEKFGAYYNRWIYLARMRGGAKLGMSVAVYRDQLYMVGGYSKDAPGGPVLADVECFDLTKQEWVEKNPLQTGRCHACLVLASGSLFLLGGRMRCEDSGTMYSVGSVLKYDYAEDMWHHVANMHTPRHDAGCAAIGNKIFIAGGMTSPKLECLASVECLDTISNNWISGVAPLPSPAAGLACASIPQTR